MKTKKYASLAMLLAVGVVGVGGVVHGEEVQQTLDGKATIQYEKSTTGVPPVDPENPEKPVIIDPEDGNNNQGTAGELRIDYLSYLKFGKNPVTTMEKIYNAAPTTVTIDGKKEMRGNYVQVTDQRSNSTIDGWTLTAKVTKPFTNEQENVLKGAEIIYTLPHVQSTQSSLNFPTVPATFTLATTGDNISAATVATAETGKGWGTYTIEFGRPGLNDAGEIVNDDTATIEPTMGSAVKLKVPANTPLDSTSPYEATITWQIAAL